MLKGALFVFVGLFIMMTLISLLIPSKVVIAKAVTVQADSLKLFKEISDLKNWKHWHPVFMNDSAGIKYSNFTDKVNAVASWTTTGKENKMVVTKMMYPVVEITLQRDGENDVINIFSVMPVLEQGNMQVQ